MATMDLFIKPYMVRQAIEHNTLQTTLEDIRDSIGFEVNTQLPFACPQCAWIDPDQSQPNPMPGEGLIINPNNPSEKIECPTCSGWCATETAVTTERVFGTATPPNVLQP